MIFYFFACFFSCKKYCVVVNKIYNKKINFVWGALAQRFAWAWMNDYLYSEVVYSALGNLTKDELMQNYQIAFCFSIVRRIEFYTEVCENKFLYTTQFE